MLKHKRFRKEFLNILQDGEKHRAGEIEQKCLEKGIDIRNKRSILYSTAHQLKKQGILDPLEEKGVYKLKKTVKDKYVDIEFDNCVKKIKKELKKYREFSWLNCSEEEWREASIKGRQMKELADEIMIIFS